jgi:hypothetical protein
MRNRSNSFHEAATLYASLLTISILSGAGSVFAQPDPNYRIHDWTRPRPAIVDPGRPSTQEVPGKAPSDAIVLFDGTDLSQWCAADGGPTKWVIRNSAMECTPGSGAIRTLQNFGDCQLHIEWTAPTPPKGRSQGRGNSGVFLMNTYEIQVLDSFQNETYADGQASAVYAQYPPLVNAALPPGQWQTYDILFAGPRFDDQGQLKSPARVTVLHNGVLVQNNVTLTGPTNWLERAPYRAHPEKMPLGLQDHGNPVRYRNIWIRELSDAALKEYTYSDQLLAGYEGSYQVDGGMKIVIVRKGTQLTMRLVEPTRDREFQLAAGSRTRFFSRKTDLYVDFQTNDKGVAQSLTLTVAGDPRQARRVPN